MCEKDKIRVIQSLDNGTDGFNSVLDRLDSVSQNDDFVRPQIDNFSDSNE